MVYNRPVRYTDALRNVTAKRVLPVAFSSRELERDLPAAIAERAIFSARTPYVSYLAQTQEMIANLVAPAVTREPDGTLRRAGRGESLNPAKVRTLMRAHLESLGYVPSPDEAGGLTDLGSDRRIELIINMQTQLARGYARQRLVQSDAIRKTFPADELYRALPRKEKRNWHLTWNEARARLGDRTQATRAYDRDNGPFIAPKNDPIWAAISRFGHPYPPFDYGSGMRVRSVLASVARRHGITRPPAAERDPLNDRLAAPIRPGTSQALLDVILRAFPGAEVVAGAIRWKGASGV